MKKLALATALIITALTGQSYAAGTAIDFGSWQWAHAQDIAKLESHESICIDKVRSETFKAARTKAIDDARGWSYWAKLSQDQRTVLLDAAADSVRDWVKTERGPFCREVTRMITVVEQKLIKERAESDRYDRESEQRVRDQNFE